jgi:molybdenum cofactor biosynthesis enzyme MoaA
MKVKDIIKIAASLNLYEKKQWISLFQSSVKPDSVVLDDDCFENFIIALYATLKENISGFLSPIIAYGAGNIAKDFLPQIRQYTDIIEIWDSYSGTDFLYDIPVVRPHFDTADSGTNVVIFIDNCSVRYDVISLFELKGYAKVYSYKDFILILESISYYSYVGKDINDNTRRLLNSFVDQYEIICSKYAPVNYSAIPQKYKSAKLVIESAYGNASDLSKRLFALLTVSDSNRSAVEKFVFDFFGTKFENEFNFAYQMEIFLRRLLADGVKTRERPIRMLNDSSYDQFAVFAAVRETLECVCNDFHKSLTIIRLLRKLSPNSVPLMSVECYFLIKCNHLEEALQLSRYSMRKEPNALLSNETFYQIAIICKEKGIYVAEPLPEYDLGERFCWSGIQFALCSGFDAKENTAEFLPCFRTLQCAAYPNGNFWSGDEWVEFRKSLVDGSFKYCQKNQCSNIVAGWLPKKADCKSIELRKIFKSDFSVIPQLDELHFSYDFHCNLKCPSCRLEIKSNSAERNEELNMLFEKNLRPLLKTAKHLCLSGCGEAIISPHSKHVLQSLSPEEYPELAIELRTNVFSFNPTTWNTLGTGGNLIRHVAASIDAASKELFEQFRYPAKWDVVLKNLTFIQSLRNSGEIDMFEFHVVVQTDNIGELTDIIKMAAKYDADVITFSQLVNWRGMSEAEYRRLNPFLEDNPRHGELMQVIEEIKNLRVEIENDECDPTCGKKKLFINMHCVPDPNSTYDAIRIGKLKIR